MLLLLRPAEESNDSTSGGTVLKSTVSATDYLPKDGDPNVMEAQSIKSIRGQKRGKADKGSLTDQAAAVKVGPLPLLETDGESQQKASAAMEAEKAELADLWESTLTRSPDIQFIVQKLQPTSNQAHLTNVLAKMLSYCSFWWIGCNVYDESRHGHFCGSQYGWQHDPNCFRHKSK